MNTIHQAIRSLTVVLFLFLWSNNASAQGIVMGKVTDASDGSAIWGATVMIEGKSVGMATDDEGKYRLTNLDPGPMRIIFRYLGYESVTRDVTIDENAPVTLDIALKSTTIQGEEVVVTGQRRGQLAAINQQITSNKITNVVSKDRIRELPDNNAAESISRLPGVSIQRDAGEGTKIIVRGLEPKYNSITINGQKIPATDAQNRSVDLSMISSDILAGMEVVKALTPDMDADAVGGTVNFEVKKAEAGLQSDVRLLGGYNDLNNDYKNIRGNATISDRFFDESLGVIIAGNWQRANRGSDNLSASYGVVGTLLSGAPDIRLSSLSLVDKVETRFRYGANLILDYVLPNGSIVFNSLYSRTDRDEVRRRKGYSTGSSPIVRYVLRQSDINTDLFTNAFTGKHNFGAFKIDWALSSLYSRQNTPFMHESEFREIAAFGTGTITSIDDAVRLALNDTSNTILYTDRYGTELNVDKDLNGQVDITVPLNLADEVAATIQFGAKVRSKKRTLDGEFQYMEGKDLEPLMRADSGRTYTTGSTLYLYPGISNFYDNGFSYGEFLQGRYVIGPAGPLSTSKMDAFLTRYKSSYKPDYETDQKDYRAGESIYAGYVMSEINVGPLLMFLPGVRYEKTVTHYANKHSSDVLLNEDGESIAGPAVDTLGSRWEEDFLPMVHLRVIPVEWFSLRLAFTRTLTRPDYIDLVPWERETSDGLERGNPYLKNAKIWNYDAFASFYGNYGLVTVGAYYKRLENISYIRKSRATSIRGAGVVDYYHPENSSIQTKVYGLEVEVQSNLSMLPSPFDGVVLNLNYSIVRSETQFPYQIKRSLSRPPFTTTYKDTVRSSRMPGQANQLANITVGYEKKEFSARISLAYQGDALQIIGASADQDGFSKEFLRWDVAGQYKILPQLAFTMNVNNLTSLPEGSYLGFMSSPTREEYFGWTMDVGLRYEF